MTMAVGMISSSELWAGAMGGNVGVARWPKGGEPPAEEKSELFWGERERTSGGLVSSHLLLSGDWANADCWDEAKWKGVRAPS